jgi:hypothetical protein
MREGEHEMDLTLNDDGRAAAWHAESEAAAVLPSSLRPLAAPPRPDPGEAVFDVADFRALARFAGIRQVRQGQGGVP